MMTTIPFEIGTYYHIYNRGNNKENLFFDEKNYTFFLQKVKQHLLPICNIYAYCLMPNHFHLIVEIKNELPIEYINGDKKLHQPFSNLFNAYTKAINKSYSRTGSLFQEHPHRKIIDSEEYLRDLILYIHLNPIKHGFDTDYKNYKHSSYQALVSNKETNLVRNEVIALFGDMANFKYCHQMQLYYNLDKLNDVEYDDL